jgi:alkylation response protein AidB-like acyl-CoA dehydrogenase
MIPEPLSEILQRAREVADDVLAPNAARIDAEASWPVDGLRALQRAGLGGLVVPRAHGGLGHALLGVAQVSEVLGHACASTALCFGMHCVAAAVLAAKATDDQAHRYLQPICAGNHLATLALSEPGTGAHFYIPRAELCPQSPEAFTVRGTKSFVTSGAEADSYVVSATTAVAGAAVGQFSCVVVPRDAPGLVWGGAWQGFGMRGNCSRTVDLRDVPVPRADLLGQEGDHIWYVFNVIAPYCLTSMAGTYLGVATAALEEARAHLTSRRYEHSGSALGSSAVLQHRLGAMFGAVERGRQMLYHAARQADAGASDALPLITTAKAEAADAVGFVVGEAMTLMGGIAYAGDAAMMRRLRDARAAPIMSPATDLLRVWTGRALLGLPILGD